MSSFPPYRFVELDSHYAEPEDCFTRHLERRFRSRGARVGPPAKPGEPRRVMLGDEPHSFMPTWMNDATEGPGAYLARKRAKRGAKSRSAAPAFIDLADYPEFQQRDARLRKMDELNTEAGLFLPSQAIFLDAELARKGDLELLYAQLRAFNRWLEDDWGYVYENRIFAPPLLALDDRERAIAELDRVIERGARSILFTPRPAGKRSPADPYFDAFWARASEAELLIAVHFGDPRYHLQQTSVWSEDPATSFFRISPFQMSFFLDRPIMDWLSCLVLHNLFGRFPKLKVAAVEFTTRWVPYLVDLFQSTRLDPLTSDPHLVGGSTADKPAEIFKRHVYVTPLISLDSAERVLAAMQAMGDHIVLGSDYPHPEGATPADCLEQLEGRLPEAALRRFMRGTGAELLGLTP